MAGSDTDGYGGHRELEEVKELEIVIPEDPDSSWAGCAAQKLRAFSEKLVM
jgi:hypothetical protein